MVSDIINTLICTLKKGLMQPAVSVKTDVPKIFAILRGRVNYNKKLRKIPKRKSK